MQEILQTIAKNIRHYRLKKNLTQAQLAERADLSRGYICQVEHARINMYLTTLAKIAKVFKLKPSDLVK